MFVEVIDGWLRAPSAQDEASAYLRRDNWDDFGYKTTFDLVVNLPDGSQVEPGKVKVLKLGQRGGRVDLPSTFESLNRDFISLGQDYNYYEALARLDAGIHRDLLRRLNDVVFRPKLRSRFLHEPGYEKSLLRFSSAQSALTTAAVLFDPSTPDEPNRIELAVETSVGGLPFEIDFEWDRQGDLPGHLAAVIGYNGSGKTELLANLAFIAAATGISADDGRAEYRGQILSNSLGTFGGVITISYSAFDTFALPFDPSDYELAAFDSSASDFGYSYIGLRRPQPSTGVQHIPVEYKLKSSSEIAADFRAGLERVKSRKRSNIFEEALTLLMKEPSFSNGGLRPDTFADAGSAMETFETLSTGHKVVLNVVVHLVAQLQPRTLVLIDEPESHLHPPLVAALLAAISLTVKRYDSVAVIATHSPVVIQEIPARHVRVLRRVGRSTVVERLEVESFAENIGYLTRTVFNLDSSATDFQRVLRRLLSRYSLEEIDALFLDGLSQQGRAVLATLESEASNSAED